MASGMARSHRGLAGTCSFLHQPTTRPARRQREHLCPGRARLDLDTSPEARAGPRAVGCASGSTAGPLTTLSFRTGSRRAAKVRAGRGRGGGLHRPDDGVAAQAPERTDEFVDVGRRASEPARGGRGRGGSHRGRTGGEAPGFEALGGRGAFLSEADPGRLARWAPPVPGSTRCVRTSWDDSERAYLSTC